MKKKIGNHKKFSAFSIYLIFGITSLVAPLCQTAHPAEQISIKAYVNSNTIGMLDTLELKVTVESQNIMRVPSPRLPDLSNFLKIDSSTQTSTTLSIINGKTIKKKKIVHTYRLQPKKTGEYIIGPVTITYKGQIYSTTPIKVTVVEGHVERGSAEEPSAAPDLRNITENLFLKVTPSEKEVYEGEQIFLTYKLYTQVEIDSVSLKENPDYNGFYRKEIFNANRLNFQRETLNDKEYETSLIKKVTIFPLKPGEYKLEPLVLEATVLLQNEEIFSVFSRPYTLTLTSNDVVIKVKQLPNPESRINFSYIVGTLETSLSKREQTIRTGSPSTVYLTLRSTGNLSLISDPGIITSLKARTYLSDTIEDVIEQKDKVYFIKKFEYTIIPEQNGELRISAPEFYYFDPVERKYKKRETVPISIRVVGPDISYERQLLGREQRLTGVIFNYIKPDVKSLKNTGSVLTSSPIFYLTHAIGIITLLILFFFKIKSEKLHEDIKLYRYKKAKNIASRSFKNIKHLMDESKLIDARELIYNTLREYIANKSGLKPQEITIKKLPEVLTHLGISDEIKKDVIKVMNTCYEERFSPVKDTNKEKIKDITDKTVALIDKIELELKEKNFSRQKYKL